MIHPRYLGSLIKNGVDVSDDERTPLPSSPRLSNQLKTLDRETRLKIEGPDLRRVSQQYKQAKRNIRSSSLHAHPRDHVCLDIADPDLFNP
jgi:hypothetical protein